MTPVIEMEEVKTPNAERPTPNVERGTRPIDVAQALYASRGWDFEKQLTEYLRSEVGHIFKGANYFALARPVMLESEQPAWHVDVAVGKLETLLALMPFELPFISFHRDAKGGLRVYETERVRRLTQRRSPRRAGCGAKGNR